MKIWDCFPFRDELDMLECRLMQLENSPVYRHVLVEAAVDHRGFPKPLVFLENQDRFAPWRDRIVHVIADELPAMIVADPWAREAAQRDAASAGLADAAPDDWLILADVDEIPSSAVTDLASGRHTGICEMTCCIFAVDWLLGPMRTSVLCQAGPVTSLSATRRAGWEWQRFGGTGHHLTWLGGQAAITAKIAAHCHQELDVALASVNSVDGLYGKGINPGLREFTQQLTPVDVDSTWPRYVYERRCPPVWFRPRPGNVEDQQP